MIRIDTFDFDERTKLQFGCRSVRWCHLLEKQEHAQSAHKDRVRERERFVIEKPVQTEFRFTHAN